MNVDHSMESLERGDLQRFPLLPLRDIVVFPHMVVPLFVGRERSISALEAAMNGNRMIFLAAQRNAKTEDPGRKTSTRPVPSHRSYSS